MKIVVLGASGMLGNAVFRFLAESPQFSVYGAVRSPASALKIPESLRERVVVVGDADDEQAIVRAFEDVRPDAIINCIGLVKQLAAASDPLVAIPINAMLPHRLARSAARFGARLIHFSTDCVFSGSRGMYREGDFADCNDLYGRSKLLGEVDYPNALTLRTSIIGHELDSAHGLLNWFLAQEGRTKGYVRAVFSGLPTVEVARVLRDYVLPRPTMHGVYHLSAAPINKSDLLRLFAQIYGKSILIDDDDRVRIDRSLDSSRFRTETGYMPPSWPDLVQKMRDFG